MRQSVWVLVLFLGCGADPEAPPRATASLVDHGAWERTSEGDDPFASLRAGRKPCDDTDIKREDITGFDSVQVSTRDCGYVTLTQPSAADVRRGERLHIRLWQYQLEATVATAEVAVQVGASFQWAKSIALPADSKLYDEKVAVGEDIPAGAPVYLHVRNHGKNSYNLILLRRE